MKKLYTLLLIISLVIVGCSRTESLDDRAIAEGGVSRELADWRKSTIKEIIAQTTGLSTEEIDQL